MTALGGGTAAAAEADGTGMITSKSSPPAVGPGATTHASHPHDMMTETPMAIMRTVPLATKINFEPHHNNTSGQLLQRPKR